MCSIPKIDEKTNMQAIYSALIGCQKGTIDGDDMRKSIHTKGLVGQCLKRDSEILTPVPYNPEDCGINYSFIDYDNSYPPISHQIKETKPDTNQIIYEFSDLNDIIVRKMISFRKDSLNFTNICKKPSINSIFIREFLDKIDFVELTKNDSISRNDFEIIDEFIDHFNWDELCKNVRISPRFIEKYYDNIKWDSIIFNITFIEEYILKYEDKINFALLLNFEKRVLSNTFVRNHIDILNIDTEDKMLRLFNNIPITGSIFQTIITKGKMSRDIRGEIPICEDTVIKSVSPWNNTEQVVDT